MAREKEVSEIKLKITNLTDIIDVYERMVNGSMPVSPEMLKETKNSIRLYALGISNWAENEYWKTVKKEIPTSQGVRK